MIEEIKADADERMGKSLESLHSAFARIRTGRASPGLLDGIEVPYYGTDTPLSQVASITVEDARTLSVSPWEKNLIPEIEKAILKSDLGITPAASSDTVRIPLPALTEVGAVASVKVASATTGAAAGAGLSVVGHGGHDTGRCGRGHELGLRLDYVRGAGGGSPSLGFGLRLARGVSYPSRSTETSWALESGR